MKSSRVRSLIALTAITAMGYAGAAAAADAALSAAVASPRARPLQWHAISHATRWKN
jgi:hypothetical protein